MGTIIYSVHFLFARHANNSEELEETLTLNRQEVNAMATALLATVGWEVSSPRKTRLVKK